MKKVLVGIGVGLAVIIGVVFFAFTNWRSKMMKMTILPVDDQLTIIEGGGGNSIVLVSEDGTRALVVDTKMGEKPAKELAERVKGKEVVVVNTHSHMDHTGGNTLFSDAIIISGAHTPEEWKMMTKDSRYPDRTVSVGTDTVIEIGSERVHLRNMGQAHTRNDLVVWLEHRNLLMTGDIVFSHIHPVMIRQGGTNAAAWMRVLDTLITAYPACAVVPGHGHRGDNSELHDMRNYFTDVREAVATGGDLKTLQSKYASYHSIPLFTGFDKTVAFFKNEREGGK